MEPVVMEQLDLVRTDSISPTSTSDSTEVDFYSRVFILGWVVCIRLQGKTAVTTGSTVYP